MARSSPRFTAITFALLKRRGCGQWLIPQCAADQTNKQTVRYGQSSIQLQDLANGEVLTTLQSPVPSHVISLAFSPDDAQLAVTHRLTRELLVWDLRLIREQLAKMGLDWNRPPYPPVADKAEFKFTSITVLGKESPLGPEPKSPVK